MFEQETNNSWAGFKSPRISPSNKHNSHNLSREPLTRSGTLESINISVEDQWKSWRWDVKSIRESQRRSDPEIHEQIVSLDSCYAYGRQPWDENQPASSKASEHRRNTHWHDWKSFATPILSCCAVSCYVMPCHIVSYHVIWSHVTSRQVKSSQVKSSQVLWPLVC